MSRKKRRAHPVQEAPEGSTWELIVNKAFVCLVVVVGERLLNNGSYPCVVIERDEWWSSKPGTRMNAAVTTASGWRRVT
jgi:hypothetical protein